MLWIVGAVIVALAIALAGILVPRLLDRVASAGGAVEGDASALAGQVIAQLAVSTHLGRTGVHAPWDGRSRLREPHATAV